MPAQTLNKFMFSGQSEKLEVMLIFLENRDLCADQGGWGRLLWKSEYELQRGGFIGGHLKALMKRIGCLKSRVLETAMN